MLLRIENYCFWTTVLRDELQVLAKHAILVKCIGFGLFMEFFDNKKCRIYIECRIATALSFKYLTIGLCANLSRKDYIHILIILICKSKEEMRPGLFCFEHNEGTFLMNVLSILANSLLATFI